MQPTKYSTFISSLDTALRRCFFYLLAGIFYSHVELIIAVYYRTQLLDAESEIGMVEEMGVSYLSPRENIVLTALAIIDEQGLPGLRMREIARRLDMTETELKRNFRSKDELLVALVAEFARFDDRIVETARESAMPSADKIRFLMNSFLEQYENYSELVALLFSEEALRGATEASGQLREIIQGRFDFLEEIIANGQAHGELTGVVKARDLAMMIFGLVNSTTQRWRYGTDSFPLKATVMSGLDSLLQLLAPDGKVSRAGKKKGD